MLRLSTLLPLLLSLATLQANAGGIRFVTYNVWGLPAPLLQLPQRFPEIRDAIPALNADVIGFNEAFSSNTNILANTPGFKYVARGPSGSGLLKQSAGLMLISKHKITKTKVLKYSVCQGSDCMANKGVLFAQIEPVGGPTVNVFITHTNAFDTEPVRVQQVNQLLKFIKLNDDGSPVVVMGDMNTTPGTESYKLFTEEEGLTDTHEVWAQAHPGLNPNEAEGLTYVTNRSDDPSVKEKGWRFDYIFARSKRQVWVNDSRVIFKSKVNGHYLSDHNGYTAELEL